MFYTQRIHTHTQMRIANITELPISAGSIIMHMGLEKRILTSYTVSCTAHAMTRTHPSALCAGCAFYLINSTHVCTMQPGIQRFYMYKHLGTRMLMHHHHQLPKQILVAAASPFSGCFQFDVCACLCVFWCIRSHTNAQQSHFRAYIGYSYRKIIILVLYALSRTPGDGLWWTTREDNALVGSYAHSRLLKGCVCFAFWERAQHTINAVYTYAHYAFVRRIIYAGSTASWDHFERGLIQSIEAEPEECACRFECGKCGECYIRIYTQRIFRAKQITLSSALDLCVYVCV